MAVYEFQTVWLIRGPLESVWKLIYDSDKWPEWWPGVEQVERLSEGDANHVGAIHRYTWKSKLPYRLTFEMRLTRVEPMRLIEGEAIGELAGIGRWQFAKEGDNTRVTYDWRVETTKAWMNVLAPIARPIFRWNHDVVMNWGGQALAKRVARIRDEG